MFQWRSDAYIVICKFDGANGSFRNAKRVQVLSAFRRNDNILIITEGHVPPHHVHSTCTYELFTVPLIRSCVCQRNRRHRVISIEHETVYEVIPMGFCQVLNSDGGGTMTSQGKIHMGRKVGTPRVVEAFLECSPHADQNDLQLPPVLNQTDVIEPIIHPTGLLHHIGVF